MENFRKQPLSEQNIPEDDLGIKVSELLSILGNNKLSAFIVEKLNVKSIKDEFIAIKGARTLVRIQKSVNRRFHKEDLISELADISLYNSNNEFTINFNNIDNNEYFQAIDMSMLSSIPIYSAARDFFSELYQMDKYASVLIKNGFRGIVETNLSMLKEIHTTSKRYRILHDLNDNLFYLRAIISLRNYHNYDNNIAIVISLLTLHNETKRTGLEYRLKKFEYNESFIRAFFESSEVKQLEGIGKVKNLIEISNDEIKREALRFSGVCSIVFGQEDGVSDELFIQPQEIKSRILSVKHNQVPKTAIQELSNIEKSSTVHENIYNDILKIAKIKNPDQIKFLVLSKVENATNEDIKKHKSQILAELSHSVSNILQLLTVFRKIELLASEDIEATEYLRFIIYQALIEKK